MDQSKHSPRTSSCVTDPDRKFREDRDSGTKPTSQPDLFRLTVCANRLRAAQIVDIGRRSLYRYLKRGGVDTRGDAVNGDAANGSEGAVKNHDTIA
jgi:hypothetical protein